MGSVLFFKVNQFFKQIIHFWGKDIKLSKRCQISKSQTSQLWRRFTQKINSHNDVHTYWCQFWCQISRWPKLVTNTFYLHFEGFWWSWYVMSKLMSISVNHIMSINFFVNLLHSLPVCFLDIWHLFDNLTSFDIFIAAYIIWGNVIISHLSVHLSPVGYLPYLGVPTLALGGTYLGKVPTLAWGTYIS